MSPAIPLPKTRKSNDCTEDVGRSMGWYSRDAMLRLRPKGEAWQLMPATLLLSCLKAAEAGRLVLLPARFARDDNLTRRGGADDADCMGADRAS